MFKGLGKQIWALETLSLSKNKYMKCREIDRQIYRMIERERARLKENERE